MFKFIQPLSGLMKVFNKSILLLILIVVLACDITEKPIEKIDRFALVNRHHVYNSGFDSLNSLSVGNGQFAFTVDATGLQTFPDFYEDGVCLGTQSEWGWHSFPNNENYDIRETWQNFNVEERQVPYAVQWKEPKRKQEAANYFRSNPHRLHLGMLGLELIKADKTPATKENIKNCNQKLDVWKGVILSAFEFEKDVVEVQTLCHPKRDLIGVSMQSEKIKKGGLGINLKFPYPTGGHSDNACDWSKPEKHQSEILWQDNESVVLHRKLDTTSYYVKIKWKGKAIFSEKDSHYFVLLPDKENSNFEISVEFCQDNQFAENRDFHTIKDDSEKAWQNFWETGGAVDFSATDDPRAKELERRVILSQYLTRIQSAGSYPPQETGLTYNSWHGKHHLEMHWWHGVHWAYWNRNELLEKSLNYYFKVFEKAKQKAEVQGYEGVRWQKMTDLQGNDSPSDIGEFLIWQQPHIIYYAELIYRQKPNDELLEKYAPLIFETANFMADFARWDETNKRYILGPPLIPAQESLEKEKTVNPPFELAYWSWGLQIAQQWRKRMQLSDNTEWQKVIEDLSEFAQKDGLYLAAESAPDSYENKHYYSDHPMVLGAFGMLPAVNNLDTAIMAATFDYIEKYWNWDRTWGWDYPMAAMCATRLGKPDKAIDLLLKDVKKNTYLKNGHNWQSNRLRIYLPGNGGLLTAVAMMCAGFEGNENQIPGFPKDWKVKWENLNALI